VLPAISASRNGRPVAIASRSPERARELAQAHPPMRPLESYEAVLADQEVEAVYLPLVNSLHREWTLRALAAGKHVLCEKPLAPTAAEGMRMADAAGGSGLLLMEAFMYRFHPHMRRFRESVTTAHHVHAAFSFRLDAPGNYRLDPDLGGGALLDVGCYCVDVARWILGEPESVAATFRTARVDMSVAAALGFESALATLWASFEAPEHQELVVVGDSGTSRLERPFTAWRDPEDPYQLMVEAFADAVISGSPAPLPLESSIANLQALDRLRAAAPP
jgi:predicted dehydrogenase